MSDKTGIEWTRSDDGTPGATWNPVTGCTKVSSGCDHCYAETFAERWRGIPGHHFENGFDVTLRPDKLEQPLRWQRPRRVFVNSMSDLFHEDVPDGYIACVFTVMAKARQHTFQLLTKRHGRMRSLLSSDEFQVMRLAAAASRGWDLEGTPWPLPNVWLGVSAEDQHWADIRIPALLQAPAAVRFVSAEPLLGPVTLFPGKWIPPLGGGPRVNLSRPWEVPGPSVSWLIVGGESGPGARRMAEGWARNLVGECTESGTPVFVKQLGSVLGKELGAGPKGGDWDRWPEDLKVRQFPCAAEAARLCAHCWPRSSRHRPPCGAGARSSTFRGSTPPRTPGRCGCTHRGLPDEGREAGRTMTAVDELQRPPGSLPGVPGCSAMVPLFLEPGALPDLMRCPEPPAAEVTCACGHVRSGWLCEEHEELLHQGGCRPCLEDKDSPHPCRLTARRVTEGGS